MERLWCIHQQEPLICAMNNSLSSSSSPFKGRHFDSSIIILCVRWYITYKLSYRDLRAMMPERDLDLAHTTTLRWVLRYVPEFEKKWHRFARPVGSSWRVDETYTRVRGKLKRFDNAEVPISGIELAHKIGKGQFDTSELMMGKCEHKGIGKRS
jgi:hypothetical protein